MLFLWFLSLGLVAICGQLVPLRGMKPGQPSIVPRKKNKKEQKRFLIQDAFSYLFKSAGLIVWVIVFGLALLEIKQYYHIDLIPGYDSAVDDVYGAIRGFLSELFGF